MLVFHMHLIGTLMFIGSNFLDIVSGTGQMAMKSWEFSQLSLSNQLKWHHKQPLLALWSILCGVEDLDMKKFRNILTD